MGTSDHSRNDGTVPARAASRALPIHPFLIAAFPILSLYANNLNDVRIQDITRPLGLSVLLACVLWALIALAARHVHKGAIAASLLVLAFFSYGHVSNIIPSSATILRGTAAFVCLLGVVALEAAILRSRHSFRNATAVVNLASFVLVAPSCWVIGSSILHDWQITSEVRAEERTEAAARKVVREPPKVLTAAEAASLPDIYYIILDAYAGADNLQRYYGFDNSPFIRELEKRGFSVMCRSRSNYSQTCYSLPSSLNMRYLDTAWSYAGTNTNLSESLRRRIDENEVAQVLRRQGYHYVYLWTGVEQTRVESADLRLDDASAPPPGSFERQALGLTAATASSEEHLADYERHRTCIRSGFERLGTAPVLPYPKFVFAHFSAPHPPFVFGPNGESVNPEGRYNENDGSDLLSKMTRAQYRQGYVAQVRYLNRHVLEAIDAILQKSARPPIILLQGDHGSRMNLDWKNSDKTDLRELFSILDAYLVPPQVRSHLYDGISPVNSFRVLLSSLFGENYPLLPDRSYFSSKLIPTDFKDVTEVAKARP